MPAYPVGRLALGRRRAKLNLHSLSDRELVAAEV